MQNAIGLTDVLNAANPALDIWLQNTIVTDDNTGATATILQAPTSLSFAIFDISTDTKLGTPVQVFPSEGEYTVDLTGDCVGGVAGHYAANTAVSAWSESGPIAPGRYEIVWTWQFVDDGPEYTMTRDFDVLQLGAPARFASGYCTVSDLRDEGVTASSAPDMRMLRVISQASRFVERATGRFFEPRFMAQTLDGTGGRAVQLGDPLIALQTVSLGNPVVSDIGLGCFRVFNRHLTERMINPDDRNDPKLEFVHFRGWGRERGASVDSPLFGVPFRDLYFPAGVQNVNVLGVFGYTDWDGSSTGMTPELVRHATKLIAMREYRKLACDDRDERNRYRLTQERTRDQSYSLSALTEGPFTGDREIDDILLSFVKPMALGGA